MGGRLTLKLRFRTSSAGFYFVRVLLSCLWKTRKDQRRRNPITSHPRHCHSLRSDLHFIYVPIFKVYFVFSLGLKEVSRLAFKTGGGKNKPNCEGNFQNQVTFSSPPNAQPTSVVSLGRVQPGTELEGRAKNREAQRRETEVRASRALGRTFLLLGKCFEAEPPNPWALPPSSGCAGAGAACELGLCPAPQLQSRVLGRSQDPHDSQGSGPPPAAFPDPPGTPRRAALQAAPLRLRGSWDPCPGHLRAPMPGKKATGRGAARRSPAQEGRSRRPLERRRRWRRPCCGAATAASSRNSAFPSPPRSSCPETCDFLGKSSAAAQEGQARSRGVRPARRLLPPPAGAAAPARCPPGPVRWGRARLR